MSKEKPEDSLFENCAEQLLDLKEQPSY